MFLNLFDKRQPMATKTHILSQLVIIKPIPCQHILSKPNQFQRGHEMQLKMCWPKSSNVSVDKKCISTIPFHSSEYTKCFLTRYDQTYPMPAWTQIVFQQVSNNPNPCLREHEMHLYICIPHMPKISQNVSQNMLTNPCRARKDCNSVTTC